MTAPESRAEAIRRCRRCDPSGWVLGPDGLPADECRRCTHGDHPAQSADVRDITEPIHEPPAGRR